MSDEPSIVPRATDAIAAPEKLRDYCLSPDHSTGRHKARVFQSAIGIGQDDWEYLRDQLLTGILEAPIVEIRPNAFGVNYGITVLVDGLNGETHPVLTAWFIIRDEPPSFA